MSVHYDEEAYLLFFFYLTYLYIYIHIYIQRDNTASNIYIFLFTALIYTLHGGIRVVTFLNTFHNDCNDKKILL